MPTPHELLRHKRLPASRQIAVTVSVGEEVMNSTATRLFPRQFHIACCIHLSQLSHRFIQGNGQGTFLRILCAAPTFLEASFSPPDERRGNGLENLLGSPPPPLKLFSPCRSKASAHTSTSTPSSSTTLSCSSADSPYKTLTPPLHCFVHGRGIESF